MLQFEEAEAMLTPKQKSDLARFVLEDKDPGHPLNEAERTFCFGLSLYCEYEQRCEAERYL